MSADSHNIRTILDRSDCPWGEAVPKQYSQMVVSRLREAGAHLEAETLANPENALVSELIPRAVAVAGAHCVGLIFSQSPVVEATLALASSTT